MRVLNERYLYMLTPARIDLSSGIPDPSASLLTNCPMEAAMAVKIRVMHIHTKKETPQCKPHSSQIISL